MIRGVLKRTVDVRQLVLDAGELVPREVRVLGGEEVQSRLQCPRLVVRDANDRSVQECEVRRVKFELTFRG